MSTKPQRLTPLEKSSAHPKSAKLAIAAFCYHTCHSADGISPTTVKAAIRDCAKSACPLWPHRGWQNILSCRQNQKAGSNPV